MALMGPRLVLAQSFKAYDCREPPESYSRRFVEALTNQVPPEKLIAEFQPDSRQSASARDLFKLEEQIPRHSLFKGPIFERVDAKYAVGELAGDPSSYAQAYFLIETSTYGGLTRLTLLMRCRDQRWWMAGLRVSQGSAY
jgi:hypothetical protein